jgi:hypothetical protein
MQKTEQERANTGYMYGLVCLKLDRKKDARTAFELCSKSSSSDELKQSCQDQLSRL